MIRSDQIRSDQIKSPGTLGDVHRDAIGEEGTGYPNHLAVFGQGKIVSGDKMMNE